MEKRIAAAKQAFEEALEAIAKSDAQVSLELLKKIFFFFGVFPRSFKLESLCLFDHVASALTNTEDPAAARLEVEACLDALLEQNVLEGSLITHPNANSPGGVALPERFFDFVQQQHSAAELTSLHTMVIQRVLKAGENEEGGLFDSADFADPGSIDEYASKYLYWHFASALNGQSSEKSSDGSLGGGKEWLEHPDTVVVANAAAALGKDTLLSMSKEREEKGEALGGAQASWAVVLLKDISREERNESLYKTMKLLVK